jgi:hypothetical protein
MFIRLEATVSHTPQGMARILDKDEIFKALLSGTPLAQIDARFTHVLQPDTSFRSDFFINIEDPDSMEYLYLTLEAESQIEITYQISVPPSCLLLLDEQALALLMLSHKEWRHDGHVFKL